MTTENFTSLQAISPLSSNAATAQAAARWRAKVAARAARKARRATSPQHKAAVSRNKSLAATRFDALEAKAATGDLGAIHLLQVSRG